MTLKKNEDMQIPKLKLSNIRFKAVIFGAIVDNLGTMFSVSLLIMALSSTGLQESEVVDRLKSLSGRLLTLIIGLVAKIFALTVRLFANMVAGHVLLAVLLSFIFVVGAASFAAGIGVGIVVVLVSVAFNMLELFVAFLQAFIFTFLTTLFIGQAVVLHHNGHEEEHGAAETAH